MPVTVEKIYRYPVKGLNAEGLQSALLSVGQTIKDDRRFAIAHGTTEFDANDPQWLPKNSFIMLAKNERLAQLEASFDSENQILTIFRGGKQVARGKTSDIMGQTLIGQFFAGFMAGEARGTPRLVEAPGFSFSDTPNRVLSIINLASVRDLERVVRRRVDPLRFRANIYIDGLEPWHERHWIDQEITLGKARLRVRSEIDRCAATNVDPETGERDLNIPLTLRKGFRHMNMGVYAEVITEGEVAEGDEVTVPQPPTE